MNITFLLSNIYQAMFFACLLIYYLRDDTPHNYMLYILQFVYVKDEVVFNAFESIVIPLIPNYHGEMLLRLRPTEKDVIESKIELPYEIHLVTFPGDDDFKGYMLDEKRNQFLHLKEQSIRSTLTIKGAAL